VRIDLTLFFSLNFLRFRLVPRVRCAGKNEIIYYKDDMKTEEVWSVNRCVRICTSEARRCTCDGRIYIQIRNQTKADNHVLNRSVMNELRVALRPK
jgi:hypothetical protein